MQDLLVTNAALPGVEGQWDIGVRSGVIEFVRPAPPAAGRAPGAARERIDAAGDLVTPPFCDPHFHLDKVFSREHFGAVSPAEAFAFARQVKTRFTVADVAGRAGRALELAASHGIGAVRAQCDVDSFTGLVSLEGVLAARERFRGIVDVQIVAFPQEGIFTDPQTLELLREALRLGADLVGALPEVEADPAAQWEHLSTVFAIADEFGVPVDAHIDYLDDPGLGTLEMIAEMTAERGYQGRVTADHCCALAVYPDSQARRVIDKVAAADLAVTVMPMANLQMLGGPGRTPYNRGSSRLGELLDAGVNVAVGSDNMMDIWYRFNRLDPAELGLITCLSGGLRTDTDVQVAFEMTSRRAAQVMGLPSQRIEPGAPADFAVLNGPTVSEFFRNLPGRRILVRGGRVVAGREGSCWMNPIAPPATPHRPGSDQIEVR